MLSIQADTYILRTEEGVGGRESYHAQSKREKGNKKSRNDIYLLEWHATNFLTKT